MVFNRCMTIIALTVALLCTGGYAKEESISFDNLTREPVATKSYVSLTSVPAGGRAKIAIAVRIDPGWHINAHVVNDPYMIPTDLTIEPPDGMTMREVVFPAGREKKLSFSEQPLALYDGLIYIGLLVDVSRDFPLGKTEIPATITFQACDDHKCLAPVDRMVNISLEISSPLSAIDAQHTDIFAGITFTKEMAPPRHRIEESGSDASRNAEKNDDQQGRLEGVLENRGIFFLFLMVFAGGLALNLTPCVYPIIPITVSYFGGQSGGKSSRTFFLALLYVLGMAVMYSSLGLIAALTGSMLGTALQNPIVLCFVALVLVLLALSMFGVYEIRIPAGLAGIAGTSKQGSIGAFLMGLTVGIVAAPCIGPFVLGLLTFVGESGNPVLGFFLFFTLAFGLGIPFIFLALVSGSITKLPKSGEWMEWVRKLFGIILVAMAIYFLEPLLGGVIFFLLLGLLFIASGIIMGFLLKMTSKALFFLVLRRTFGIAAPLFGLYLILAPGHIIARGDVHGIAWQPYSTGLLAEAKRAKQPVVIDFYADWCLPCKELDYRTFSSTQVIKESAGILPLKVDLTHSRSPEVVKLRTAYRIKGVPTIVFLDGNGNEVTPLRVFGFVDKDDFLDRLKRLKSTS